MRNLKLIVAYDGTNYFGWQKTKVGPSIEETLQNVAVQILQHPVVLQAASRTDAGVHANGQVVNLLTTKFSVGLERLQHGLNALLPKDIVVLEAGEADIHFHPTIHSAGKEYQYFICFGSLQLPQNRLYSWHYHYDLDISKMRLAAEKLIGKRDFSSFCNVKKNSNYADYIRTLEKIEIIEIAENRLCVKIVGDHFLYKMVRNLVGTLVYVGRGIISVEEIETIVAAKSRVSAGMTAPAHGLFLQQVFY